MLLSRLAASTTVVAVLVTVTACGGSSNHSSPAESANTSSASTASAVPTALAPPAASSTPRAPGSPSDGPSFVTGGSALADTGTLITVLEAVNPKIGTDKNDLVAKSKALCARINSSETESQLESDASKGFTNGSWVPSDSEAQAIVGTVKAYGGC